MNHRRKSARGVRESAYVSPVEGNGRMQSQVGGLAMKYLRLPREHRRRGTQLQPVASPNEGLEQPAAHKTRPADDEQPFVTEPQGVRARASSRSAAS